MKKEPELDVCLEPETVVFYSWIENQPSSLRVNITGGRRLATADNQSYRTEYKEAEFRLGVYATADPQIIAALDLQIAKGADITRDYEVFLKKTMKPQDLAAHLQGKNASLTDEIEELKRQLADAEAAK